jgi:glutamine amidotransferase
MNHLQQSGLDQIISELTQPVLGICLGMQLLCNSSDENNATCLGIINAQVNKFSSKTMKVPHMGWSRIYDLQSPLFCGIKEGSYVYFVHSYYVPAGNYNIAKTNYPGPFAAAAQQDNFFATQFHPEKSGEKGARILKNFIKL